MDSKVAIIICTKDRPDFMERQFNYLANLASPHPVYIADSSNEENATRLKKALDKYRNKLTIKYTWHPPGPDNHGKLIEQVREKYACVNSDDDYQVPASLTKCAEFLEDNPDYSSAGGYSVSFRLDKGGPYGNLKKLSDYPRYSIESDTAEQRLIDFFKVIYSVSFFVNRVENMKKAWSSKLYMAQTMNELISWGHLIIGGKSKLLNCLSLVRQMHDRQYPIPTSFDWITSKNFPSDYEFFKNEISVAIAEKDNINISPAEESAKEAFWHYIQKMLSYDYRYYNTQKYSINTKAKIKLRTKLGQSFPLVKTFYRNYLRAFVKKNSQIHYEVTNPHSSYYKDFQPVVDSFTGKDIKNI